MVKDGIGRHLQGLNRVLHRYIDNLYNTKNVERLTGANCWIIGYISEHDELGTDVYQKDLERDLKITRSTASKVVKLMEQKGLISRESVSSDARLKKLVLTDKAKALHELMVSDMNTIEMILTSGFSEEELTVLQGYLNRMQRNLEKAIYQNEEEMRDDSN